MAVVVGYTARLQEYEGNEESEDGRRNLTKDSRAEKNTEQDEKGIE